MPTSAACGWLLGPESDGAAADPTCNRWSLVLSRGFVDNLRAAAGAAARLSLLSDQETPMAPFDDDHLQPVTLTWPDRIENYRRMVGREPFLTFTASDRPWLYGVWLQNDYARQADYHGAYPGDFLKRIRALFSEKRRTLHLFSGKVRLDVFPGDTCDINPALTPVYVDNAETLLTVPLEQYELVLADPPYTPADAAIYGTKMVVPGRVMTALQRLPSGAHVVWLDERVPRSSSDAFMHEGIIGLSTSAGHRFRVISIFRRV